MEAHGNILLRGSVNPSSKELVRVAVEEIRVVVKGKNLDVTPALREYAQKKFRRQRSSSMPAAFH